MSTPTPPHPGVRFPPPLVFVAGLALGWLLDQRWPLPITGPGSRTRIVLAVACGAIALILIVTALMTFHRARTAVLPFRPASALVTGGPYRFTRNPMYLAMTAVYLAVTLTLDSWWPAMLLPLVLLIIQLAVIAREERYLERAFATDYAAYRQRVRRWL